MKQTDPQYKLRLSQELKDQIEAAAKQSGRSMNAEIVARLEGSFASPPSSGDLQPSVAKEITRLTLEQRLIDMLLEQSYIEINLMWISDQLEALKGERSSLKKLELRKFEAEHSNDLRKYEHLQNSITSLLHLGEQNGIHIDTAELMNPGLPKAKPGFQTPPKEKKSFDH